VKKDLWEKERDRNQDEKWRKKGSDSGKKELRKRAGITFVLPPHFFDDWNDCAPQVQLDEWNQLSCNT
jgi:hypothetical protein